MCKGGYIHLFINTPIWSEIALMSIIQAAYINVSTGKIKEYSKIYGINVISPSYASSIIS